MQLVWIDLSQMDDDEVRLLLKRGDNLLRMERYEEALAVYEEAGDEYANLGLTVKAVALFKQMRGIVRRHHPDSQLRWARILEKLGKLYADLGLHADARTAYVDHGKLLHEAGNHEAALISLRKALAIATDTDERRLLALLEGVTDALGRDGGDDSLH